MEKNRKKLRGDEDKFVTVVSVDEDESVAKLQNDQRQELKSDTDIPDCPIEDGKKNSKSREYKMFNTESGKPMGEKPRPQPAPRQFVTVVSVGGTEKLELDSDGNVTLESNLRVRLDVPGESEDSKEETGNSEIIDDCKKDSVVESQVPDQVVVFRLPGERLGLGLKFDGGMGATEKVRRLFIQSVAPDSPAARATVPWGDLEVGDQILHIEGRHVSSMTRVECVSLLKEASVKLTIGVLKGNGNIPETEEGSYSPPSSQTRFNSMPGGGRSKRVPPPPLPPRLRPRKSPARPPKEATDWPPPPHGFEDFDNDEPVGKVARVSRTNSFTDDLDGEVTAFMSQSHRHLHRLPPTPAVYLDLLSEEDRASRVRCESESDETNSSASTVVDRLSISSSRTVSRNSSFNAAADAAKFDLARALSPFEHLEKELGSEKRQRSLSSPHLTSNEYISSFNKSGEIEGETTSENVELLNSESDGPSDPQSPSKTSPKVKVKSTMKSLSFSLKSRPFSWHNSKQSNEDKSSKSEFLTSKKSNKRPAPLPPPRSVNSASSTTSTVTTSKGNLNDKLVLTNAECLIPYHDKPEYIDISAECDNNDFCDVFENEDFPSIVEKRTENSRDSVSHADSLPSEASSSLLDSILRETKTRFENMKEDMGTSISELKNKSFDESVALETPSFKSESDIMDSRERISQTLCLPSNSNKCADDDDDTLTKGVNNEFANKIDYNDCDERYEPLNMETYECKSEFFIDRVSNPSYGFPPLALERKSLPSKIETEDELYEDVNAALVQTNTTFSDVVSVTKGDPVERSDESDEESNDQKQMKSYDISSISSCSLSTISLSSREMEDIGERGSLSTPSLLGEDTLKEDPSQPNPNDDPASKTESMKEDELSQNDQYDYVDVFSHQDSEATTPVPKRFSQISSHVRLREDLGELLREELSLEQDTRVEVEEEEVVESMVECETEDEFLLVLRALRSDNSLTLNEQCERGTPAPVEDNHATNAAPENSLKTTSDSRGNSSSSSSSSLLSRRSGRKVSHSDVTEGSDTVTSERGVAKGSGRSHEVIVKDRGGTMSVGASPLVLEEGSASKTTTTTTTTTSVSPLQLERQKVNPSEGSQRRKSEQSERKGNCEEGSWCQVRTKDPAFISGLLKPTAGDESFGATNFVRMVARNPSSNPEIKVTQYSEGDILLEEEVLPSKTPPPPDAEAESDTFMVSSSRSTHPDKHCDPPPSSPCHKRKEGTIEAAASASSKEPLGGTTSAKERNLIARERKCGANVCEGETRETKRTGKEARGTKETKNKEETALNGRNATAPLFDSPSAEKGQAVVNKLFSSSKSVKIEEGNSFEQAPVGELFSEPNSQLSIASDNGNINHLQGGGANVTLYEQRFASTSSQASPPSYSRLPPDGHEFPSSYSEGLRDKIERIAQYSAQDADIESSSHKTPNGGSPSTLPRSPPKLSAISPSSESRSASRWRRQDERSERSVRDKIAMFSNEKECSKAKNRKIDRSESVNSGRNEKTCMKRSLTEDDVRIESDERDIKLSKDSSAGKQNNRKQGKPSVYSSMINVHSSDSDSKENVKPASSEADVREKNSKLSNETGTNPKSKLKTKQGSEEKDESLSGLNSRSQSLIDIGKPSRMKRHSVGAYDRPSVYKYGIEKPEERERRTSLTNMIEQRRKSMSKLRGLVIPETRTRENNEARLPLDLPRISSHSSQNFKTMSLPRDESRISTLYKADSISSIDSCSSSASRHSSTQSSHSGKGITKLSPAHNRKHSFGTSKSDSLPPLSSRLTRNQYPLDDFSGSASTLTSQRSFDRSLTPNSEMSFEIENKYCSDRSLYSRNHMSLKSSQDSRFSRSEDSDNDSAVSSTQSSFSQSLSPRASPMPDHYDHDDRHSPTRSTRSRHSPQSSFDELDPKRVLKSGSIEAENRRNILKSAKCSSGRSSDEQSTPEIVRKFSKDRTPEPHSFPDRLDSELREGPKKTSLRREESIDSSSSVSSQHSSLDSSRRNSKDSVIHVNHKQNDVKVSAQAVYFDREGDMYKESQVKVAYLNEIIDSYEELPEDRGDVVAEIPLQNKTWSDENNKNTTLPTHQGDKWNSLGQKYSLKQEHERRENKIPKYVSSPESATSERYRYGVTTTKTDFRALADKWKQRTEEDPTPRQPQGLARTDSVTKADKPSKREDPPDAVDEPKRYSRAEKVICEPLSNSASPENSSQFYDVREERPNTLNLPRIDVLDRKFSVPEYGSGLKLREKREVNPGDIPSRPTSLIEGTSAMETLQQDGQYMTPLSPSTSTDSREDLLDSSEASLSRTGSKEVLDAFSKANLNSCATPKMSEIMRAFERHDMNAKGLSGSHPRMSSMDSTTSDDGLQGAHYGSASSLASGQRDQYGSITSLASSTSIISPQELAQLIEEANHSLEESGTPSHEILVVVLHREIVGQGSIGITLAGGADYETKEITVHKVIPGSLADRDGRIQKGDRVLSINGKTLRGVSHREALNILKSPRPEVVLVLSRSRSVTPQESTVTQSNGDAEGGFSHRSVFINHVPPPRPPKILESPMDSKSLVSDLPVETVPRGPPINITLVKDGAGLGFSLEGGKDSPLGDRPLTVKKVFSGGAADKGGVLKVGDELLGVNSVDLTNMARIEAWNFLKKLPDGKVNLVIRQKLKDEDNSKVKEAKN